MTDKESLVVDASSSSGRAARGDVRICGRRFSSLRLLVAAAAMSALAVLVATVIGVAMHSSAALSCAPPSVYSHSPTVRVTPSSAAISDPIGAVSLPNSLNFLVLGDWGRATKIQSSVAFHMACVAEMASASFVVTVGDNFYENGVNGVDDPLWRTVWRNVYLALPALRVPWYVGVGNHDYRGDCFAEEQYSALEPLWRMPAKHFTHTHSLPGGAGLFTEFVHFDTVPFVPEYYNKSSMQRCMQFADVDAEKLWLTSAVAAARANASVAWRFAVGHHPAFSVGHHGDTPSLQTFLHPLIRDAGFAAYFAGHEHDLQHLAVEGVQHFVSGGGSEYRDDPNTDEPTWSRASGGFLHASVNESHAKFQFISHTGAPLLTLLQARVP